MTQSDAIWQRSIGKAGKQRASWFARVRRQTCLLETWSTDRRCGNSLAFVQWKTR